MTTGVTLRAADGMTPGDTLKATAASVGNASEGLLKSAASGARMVIAEEGHPFYVRARKTRKPIPLGGKLGPRSPRKAIIYGVPAGFWEIVTHGSKAHRIERKLLGRGKNRHAQLLRTPYGPRPYVLHPGHESLGHPWETAMARATNLPNSTFTTAIKNAFAHIWH